MRKSVKLTKKIVAELEKHGNVFQACGKLQLATSTYYRWIKDDPEFQRLTEEAIEIGRKNMTSFSESKLLRNIDKGDQRAIEFHLRGNDPRYMNMNRKTVEEQIEKFKRENDISDKIRELNYLITGVFRRQDEVSIRKLVQDYKATKNTLQKPSGGQYYSGYDEESYIGDMMSSAFFQQLVEQLGDKLKNIAGAQKIRPAWGLRDFDAISESCNYCTYNPDSTIKKEYTKEEYKEMRRQEIRDWNEEHGVPENEGINF